MTKEEANVFDKMVETEEKMYKEASEIISEAKEVPKKESIGQKIKKHLPTKDVVIKRAKKLAWTAAVAVVAIVVYEATKTSKEDGIDACDTTEEFIQKATEMVSDGNVIATTTVENTDGDANIVTGTF